MEVGFDGMVFLGAGILIGGVITGLFLIVKQSKNKGASPQELEEKYILKELYLSLKDEAVEKKMQLEARDLDVLDLSKDVAQKDQIIKNLEQKLETQIKEVDELKERMTAEFKNIATQILDANSAKFQKTNEQSVGSILEPLKEQITGFRSRVDQIYKTESDDRASLKTEIKHLVDLNKQVSEDATNLANALKGESKTQGNWGEVQLDMILERLGLLKGVHYDMQASFVNEDGRRLQPDCVINLPENRNLVIDSKVSLTAFEAYFNTDDETKKKSHAKQHLLSVANHIKELSKKSYQNLYQINQPDYILMFVPVESALALAVKESPDILTQALNMNIVIVTGSTLIATLRTVAFIWKQDDQKKHVLEIAKQGGALYDKFVAFIEDLKKVGSSLESAHSAHSSAMNKLTESPKKGDTLIGRAERLRLLGAKTTKILSQEVLDSVEPEAQQNETKIITITNEIE